MAVGSQSGSRILQRLTWCLCLPRREALALWIFSAVLFYQGMKYLENWRIPTAKTRLKTPSSQNFKDYSSSNTETMHLICVTNNAQSPQWTPSIGVWHAGNKRFPLPSRLCISVQKHITVYTNSSPSRKYLGFHLKYLPISQLPPTFTIIENQTAYFLGNRFPFDPVNFYHFTKQVYFPLYWLIKNTNQLHDSAQNIVFYPKVYGICPSLGRLVYHPIHHYQYHFHKILNIENKLELSAFNDKPDPHNVCYKNAVFSSEIFLEKAREAVDFFKDTLSVTDQVCQPNTVVILNRSDYRRIINVNDLMKVATELGYDARVIAMETLTLGEQAQLIHCTRILVGVTGAGLQWAFFMKDHSAVIEIAWPHRHWPFFFTGTNGYRSGERDVVRPLKFVRLPNATCHLNPKSINTYFKKIFYSDANITDEDALAILQDERNYNYWGGPLTSLGKICDVVVDPVAFRAALISAGDNSTSHL